MRSTRLPSIAIERSPAYAPTVSVTATVTRTALPGRLPDSGTTTVKEARRRA
ncbi:hypothetical protein [Nonomuraea aridisoli]|uniref:hypothetical protein n=1 Tax=Nonomuraea aridisoli TaxID=2070368 RepID=UPI001F2AEF33|nr:hypothetical protein [Nonomuraea aridisoli]